MKHLVEGSRFTAWAQGIEPAADELVVIKQSPSAFFGRSLASTLTASLIDTLVITGLITSGCVRVTCVNACSHGFRPMVVSDACGDRHADLHSANLFNMNAKYGDVVTEREVCDYFGA